MSSLGSECLLVIDKEKKQANVKHQGETLIAHKVYEKKERCDAVTPCSLKDVILVYAYASLGRES